MGKDVSLPKLDVLELAAHEQHLKTNPKIQLLQDKFCFSASSSLENALRFLTLDKPGSDVLFIPFYPSLGGEEAEDKSNFVPRLARGTAHLAPSKAMTIAPFTHDWGQCWEFTWSAVLSSAYILDLTTSQESLGSTGKTRIINGRRPVLGEDDRVECDGGPEFTLLQTLDGHCVSASYIPFALS
jgi:hypothetical protein